jgi:hypothetical protein
MSVICGWAVGVLCVIIMILKGCDKPEVKDNTPDISRQLKTIDSLTKLQNAHKDSINALWAIIDSNKAKKEIRYVKLNNDVYKVHLYTDLNRLADSLYFRANGHN